MNKKSCIKWENMRKYPYEGIDKYYKDITNIKEENKLDKVSADLILHIDYVAFVDEYTYLIISIN